jgi:hypothetical protein
MKADILLYALRIVTAHVDKIPYSVMFHLLFSLPVLPKKFPHPNWPKWLSRGGSRGWVDSDHFLVWGQGPMLYPKRSGIYKNYGCIQAISKNGCKRRQNLSNSRVNLWHAWTEKAELRIRVGPGNWLALRHKSLLVLRSGGGGGPRRNSWSVQQFMLTWNILSHLRRWCVIIKHIQTERQVT